MTINELLQQTFSATEEQVSAFLEAMKNNKIFTTSEENMDIRFGKMKTQRDSVTEQLTKANATIEELQKANAGNEQLQQTVTAYQAENEKLKAQLNEAMIESEAKVSLLAEGVRDIDYAMFKLKNAGQLEMGEDGKALQDVMRNGVKSWFSNGWNSVKQSLGLRGYATGLDFVPYNEMPARLHYGEAVLTREDASAWRSGNAENTAALYAAMESMMNRMVSAIETLDGNMEDKMVSAFSSMRFDVNNREFARLVKAVT